MIIFKNFKADGIHFFTDGKQNLEMAYMKHPSGHIIKPHKHLQIKRVTKNTQEILFVKSGKVKVDFYYNEKTFVKSKELNGGDWLILFAGGHGFEILKPAILYEIKQGPYAGDQDKFRFDPIKT